MADSKTPYEYQPPVFSPQTAWNWRCEKVNPFDGCGPFEIPLALTEDQLVACRITHDYVKAISEKILHDVGLILIDEQDARRPRRLRVWLANHATRNGRASDFDQVMRVWDLMVEFYLKLSKGEMTPLHQHIHGSLIATRRAVSNSIIIGMAQLGAAKHDSVTVNFLSQHLSKRPDGSWFKEEPEKEPQTTNKPTVSDTDVQSIKDELGRIRAEFAIKQRAPKIRQFAVDNPRCLQYPANTILLTAVKEWRKMTEGTSEADFVDAMLEMIII